MKKNKLERDEYNKMQNVDMFRRRGKKWIWKEMKTKCRK
jgi:hypothetical protein